MARKGFWDVVIFFVTTGSPDPPPVCEICHKKSGFIFLRLPLVFFADLFLTLKVSFFSLKNVSNGTPYSPLVSNFIVLMSYQSSSDESSDLTWKLIMEVLHTKIITKYIPLVSVSVARHHGLNSMVSTSQFLSIPLNGWLIMNIWSICLPWICVGSSISFVTPLSTMNFNTISCFSVCPQMLKSPEISVVFPSSMTCFKLSINIAFLPFADLYTLMMSILSNELFITWNVLSDFDTTSMDILQYPYLCQSLCKNSLCILVFWGILHHSMMFLGIVNNLPLAVYLMMQS